MVSVIKKLNIGGLLIAQIILYWLILAFFLPSLAGAQTAEEEVCGDSTVNIVARDPHGDFIPNIGVEIYRQTTDADGSPKPGKKVAGGKIDPILGRYEYIFKGSAPRGLFAVKLWDKNKDVGSFWFYDELDVGCGDSITVEERLSGLDFIIRDTENNLRKNTEFSIYTERYDADGDPIKEKQDLVAKLNTSAEGEAKLYVSSGRQSLTGQNGDYYIFEMPGPQGGVYTLYDIDVNSGSLAEIDYTVSDLEIKLMDENEIPFPANTKIEIFKQAYDVDDNPILGEHIKDITTNDLGMAVFEYPHGLYAARVMGTNSQYEYFYELEIVDQQRERYGLIPGHPWQPNEGACAASSQVTVVLRDYSGAYIPGLTFEFHAVGTDVNGQPVAKTKLFSGKVDEHGLGKVTTNPNPLNKYALKIYGISPTAGDYWFFDNWQFACGGNKLIEKQLPALHIVLRDGNGNLLKNQKFSLHTQKFDVDGKPIREKKDLVSSALATGETGEAVLYVASDHPYDGAKRGTYVLSTTGTGKANYVEYDIAIAAASDTFLEYQLSDAVFELKNAANRIMANQTIELYGQARNPGGYLDLGKKILTGKTDLHGIVRFEYPAGYYAGVIKDDFGQNNIFWQNRIENRQRVQIALTANLTRVKVVDQAGAVKPVGTTITIYALAEDENGQYYKDKKLKTLKTTAAGYAEASLASRPYLFTVMSGKIEYGQALYAENGKLQNLTIAAQPADIVSPDKRYRLSRPASAQPLAEKLKGYILLQVEGRGEAWYVDINTKERYYLKDGAAAYGLLRKFGAGITNNDLNKIPIGLDERFEEFDYDGDFVPDKMEEAIGTDMYERDSDNDGHDDGDEIARDYNPKGSGKLPVDIGFANKQKGKILLQVESRGEAWYVNPKNGRRYYMQDGDSAYEIMRFLSLGITNKNLEQIEAGAIGSN